MNKDTSLLLAPTPMTFPQTSVTLLAEIQKTGVVV